jgi:hypothetical protein
LRITVLRSSRVGHLVRDVAFDVRLGASQWLDLVQGGAEVVLLGLEVVAGLEVGRELVGGAEVAGQAQGGDAAFAVDDLADPSRGTPMETAKWCWVTPSGRRNSARRISPAWIAAMLVMWWLLLSVVADDLAVCRSGGGPDEGDAPLLVDPDAAAPGHLTSESTTRRLLHLLPRTW